MNMIYVQKPCNPCIHAIPQQPGILQKYVPEEFTARAKNDLVSSNLLMICSGQSYICKVLVIPHFSECIGSIGLKLISLHFDCVFIHHGLICVFNKTQ